MQMKQKHRMAGLACLVLTAVFALTACAFSDEASVKQAATSFMEKLVNGKVADARKMCTKKAAKEVAISGLEKSFEKDMLEAFSDAAGETVKMSDLSQHTQTKLNEMLESVYKHFYRSYKIKDYDKYSKTVTVATRAIDGDFDDSVLDKAFSELIDKYTDAHLDELTETYQKGGDKAVTVAVINGVADDWVKLVDKQLAKTGTEKITLELTFEQRNGKWIITDAESY